MQSPVHRPIKLLPNGDTGVITINPLTRVVNNINANIVPVFAKRFLAFLVLFQLISFSVETIVNIAGIRYFWCIQSVPFLGIVSWDHLCALVIKRGSI